MIRDLFAHSAAYTFANIASRGTILVWLIVLPAFMSAADYGALGLLMATATLVPMVIGVEIGQGLARYYPTAAEDELALWSRTAWTFTIVMLALAGGAALLLAPILNHWLLGDPEYLPAFRVAVIYFALNASFIFLQNQFRWDFRARDFTLVTLLFALATLGLSVGLAAISPDPVFGVTVGLGIGAACGLAIGLPRLRGTIGFQIDASKLRRMLRFSAPLAVGGVALFVSTYASRYMLSGMLSLREVGLFTWASQLATIPAVLLVGVQGAVTPLVMKHHGDEQTPVVLARSFETIVVAALCLCLALGLFTPELIALLGYKSFAAAGMVVMILAPAYLMLQLYVFWPGFAVAERTGLQLLVGLVSAAAALALNYLLIQAAGLQGAALATLASSALFLGLWLALSGRLYRVPVHWPRLALFVLIAGVGAAVGLSDAVTAAPVAAKLLILTVVAAAAIVTGFAHVGRIRALLISSRAQARA